MNAAKRALQRGRWCMPVMALALLCTAGIARAQDVEPAPVSNWSVKVGAFFPTQGTMRNQTSTAWLAIGADYNPNFTHRLLDGDVFFSADLFFRDAGGKTVFILPLTANIVWAITPPESSHRVYGGIGGGAFIINPVGLGCTIQPGARFMLGADVTDSIFLQVNYDWVAGFTDDAGFSVKADGLSVFAGYRF